jgi:hypothetical protein
VCPGSAQTQGDAWLLLTVLLLLLLLGLVQAHPLLKVG